MSSTRNTRGWGPRDRSTPGPLSLDLSADDHGAISNQRLTALEDDAVEFLWKDYAHGGKQKSMTLKAIEFIRRFLLHVLPSGSCGSGTTASWPTGSCREKLALCRDSAGRRDGARNPSSLSPVAEPRGLWEAEHEIPVCPACGEGRWSSSRPSRPNR